MSARCRWQNMQACRVRRSRGHSHRAPASRPRSARKSWRPRKRWAIRSTIWHAVFWHARAGLSGLVVTNPELGYRSHLVAALTKALIHRGSVPIVINTGRTEEELVAAQKTLFGYRAEATIILSGSPPSSFVDLARRNGQPLIVLGRSETGADDVNIDNEGAGREAARFFLAGGHRRLGFRRGAVAHTDNSRARIWFPPGGRAAWRRRDDRQWQQFKLCWRPGSGSTAVFGRDQAGCVFCVNDLVAFGLIDYVRRHTRTVNPGGSVRNRI